MGRNFNSAESNASMGIGAPALKTPAGSSVGAQTEAQLAEACRQGDREAFRELFEQYRDRVYTIALRFSGSETAAMDIAQDAFVKLFDSIRGFRGDASLQTWIFRMVVNCCFDYRRRSRRFVPLPDGVLHTLRAAADSLADLVRSEQSATVRSAVDRLAPQLRMAVTLRYTEDLSYEEIAAVLGCSPGTVASRLNRAHKALERKLARFAPGNGDWNV
jgi:RNA polymerase sigma-70 factor (ECF subfamily)